MITRLKLFEMHGKKAISSVQGGKMKLLLHTCCAPCSVYCIKSLRKENIEPSVYWFNPNIHPYMEYKARRETLKEYTKSIRNKCNF